VLEGSSFTVKADVSATPFRESYWVHNGNGVPSVVSDGDTLSLDAVTSASHGEYTFFTANAFGVKRQTSISLLAVPQPGISIPADPSISSPDMGLFSSTWNSRWHFETAPTLDGPWKLAQYDRANFNTDFAELHCLPSLNGTGFFRFKYEDLSAP
jgi:hypothetical protein